MNVIRPKSLRHFSSVVLYNTQLRAVSTHWGTAPIPLFHTSTESCRQPLPLGQWATSPARTRCCPLTCKRSGWKAGSYNIGLWVTGHFIHYCVLQQGGSDPTAAPCHEDENGKRVSLHSWCYKSAHTSFQNTISVTRAHPTTDIKTHLLTVWNISSALLQRCTFPPPSAGGSVGQHSHHQSHITTSTSIKTTQQAAACEACLQ